MRGEEGGRGEGREGEVVRERSSERGGRGEGRGEGGRGSERERSSERGGRGEGREEAEEKQRSSRREI